MKRSKVRRRKIQQERFKLDNLNLKLITMLCQNLREHNEFIQIKKLVCLISFITKINGPSNVKRQSRIWECADI